MSEHPPPHPPFPPLEPEDDAEPNKILLVALVLVAVGVLVLAVIAWTSR